MKIIMSYLQEDEKLQTCLDSLKKYSPEIEIVKLKSDPQKTKSSENAFDNYFKENGMDDDYMIWHPDMIATRGWYDELLKYYGMFDVVGVKLVYPNNKTIQHYGGCLFADGKGFHPHQHCLNIGSNEPLSCAYVTGPGMVVKKHVWEKLKGWDHSYWCYIDVDFCIRAQKAGFTVGVVPVTLMHSEGADQLRKRTFKFNENLLKEGHKLLVAKHMEWLAKYK